MFNADHDGAATAGDDRHATMASTAAKTAARPGRLMRLWRRPIPITPKS